MTVLEAGSHPGQQHGAAVGALVSVVVPVFNDFERLALCLRALAQQSWPRAALEVLVVDNGSAGDIRPVLAPFEFARLLEEPRPGSYAARNRALREARGEVLAFTDVDCIPDPEWLEQGVAALRRAGPGAVVGGRVEVFPHDAARATWAEEFELALGFSQQLYVEQRHYCATANMFTSAEVFVRVGPFNDVLKSGGDQEWGRRAFAAGVRFAYAEGALVRHPARRTLGELLRKRARLVGGHLSMARAQHPEWLAFSKVFLKACLPPVVRVARAHRRGKGGWRRDARVFAVGTLLQAWSVRELMRLRLGGAPKR
ncbi:MAG TPA: glycosyltransferase family A protein [Polyangiaceae bacterium]|nr:glycosyltransferase family A protein [Polyangiaceae bacterium]